MEKNKGTISFGVATVGAIIVAVTGWSASYFGTISAQNDKVADVRLEVTKSIADVKNTVAAEQSKSDQFEKRMDRFETKIDRLLESQGINPKNVQIISASSNI